MPQTPQAMSADQGYEGWETLSPYQKVERMMAIHKSGHDGEDVSDHHFVGVNEL
jgi:hypothetical protein